MLSEGPSLTSTSVSIAQFPPVTGFAAVAALVDVLAQLANDMAHAAPEAAQASKAVKDCLRIEEFQQRGLRTSCVASARIKSIVWW
jgi:hypothetical protein